MSGISRRKFLAASVAVGAATTLGGTQEGLGCRVLFWLP